MRNKKNYPRIIIKYSLYKSVSIFFFFFDKWRLLLLFFCLPSQESFWPYVIIHTAKKWADMFFHIVWKRSGDQAVSTSDLGLNPAWCGIQSWLVTALHPTEPFIITLSRYDLNNVERDIKHQICSKFLNIYCSISLGPVVQSIVSLTSSLAVKMLTVLVSTISNSHVFLQKKCE